MQRIALTIETMNHTAEKAVKLGTMRRRTDKARLYLSNHHFQNQGAVVKLGVRHVQRRECSGATKKCGKLKSVLAVDVVQLAVVNNKHGNKQKHA